MDETNNITFESYFSGNMSAKEALDFETALDSNPELSEEYKFFLSVKESTFDIHRDLLREQLDIVVAIDNEHKENKTNNVKPKKTSKIINLIKITSAVACLFLIGFWVGNMSKPQGNEELFATYFETYTPQNSRGESAELLQIDRSDLNTPELKLLYASGQLSQSLDMNKYEEAIDILAKISDESALRDQKYWYLGLANLKVGKMEEVKKNFTYLKSVSNFKKQEIEKILSAIK